MIVDLLPASDGDCLLVTWDNGGRAAHMLVDGGRIGSHREWEPIVRHVVGPDGQIDLLVVTHVDADHIGGLLAFLRQDEPKPRPRAIWFNGQAEVAEAVLRLGLEPFGVAQADKVSKQVERLALRSNVGFDGHAVLADVPPASRDILGAGVTVLSPDLASLAAMGPTWDGWIAKEGLLDGGRDPSPAVPGYEALGAPDVDVERLAALPEAPDRSTPNGSSIAFVLEHAGRRILLCADAHPDALCARLSRLAGPSGRYGIDLMKVSHHGGAGNTTRELLERIDCVRFAFCTDGGRHDHPSGEAVARILSSTDRHKTLYFNYRQPWTECWDDPALMQTHNYSVVFSDSVDGHLRIHV